MKIKGNDSCFTCKANDICVVYARCKFLKKHNKILKLASDLIKQSGYDYTAITTEFIKKTYPQLANDKKQVERIENAVQYYNIVIGNNPIDIELISLFNEYDYLLK